MTLDKFGTIIIGGRTGAAVAGDMIAMWNRSRDENMTSELLSLMRRNHVTTFYA